MGKNTKILNISNFQQDSFSKESSPVDGKTIIVQTSFPNAANLPRPKGWKVSTSNSNGYNKPKSTKESGGDDGMKSDYVTHEELNHFEDNLRHEIKESQLETKNSITDLSGKIDKVSANIDTKFEKVNTHFEIINTKFANQKVWIITTIVSTVGVGVGLLSFIMNLMLHK